MTSRANKRPPAVMPEVQYDVPLPEGALERHLAWKAGGPPRWPWSQCEVGGSFFAAGYTTSTRSSLPTMNVRAGAAIVAGSRWMMLEREESGVRGVRVWRIK